MTYDGQGSDLSHYSMLELFRMEVEKQVADVTKNLIYLEQHGCSVECLEALMRAAHSLKGAARMINATAIVRIAHELEECFVAAQNKELVWTREVVDQLLTVLDTISSFASETDEQVQQQEIKYANQLRVITESLRSLSQLVAVTEVSAGQWVDKAKSDKGGVDKDYMAALTTLPTVRVGVDRLNRIMTLAGKMLVEVRRLPSLLNNISQFKRRQLVLGEQLERLHMAMDEMMMGESARMQLQSVSRTALLLCQDMTDRFNELDAFDRRSSLVAEHLHREVLASRMRPFSDIVQGVPRLVRDLERMFNKQIELSMHGITTLVDREVLERLEGSLHHVIRNAIDHGLETAAEREKADKPIVGQLAIKVNQQAGMLTIEVRDDGRGVDTALLRTRLTEKVVEVSDSLPTIDDEQLLDYLFLPGFSTKQQVNEISGRGVGLDIVREAVESINGSVCAKSVDGQGMQVIMQVPLIVSIIKTLLVEIDGESYAFILSSIHRILKIDQSELVVIDEQVKVRVDEQLIDLVHANQVFDLPLPLVTHSPINILVLGDWPNCYAIVVGDIQAEQELVVQPLDKQLGKIPGISAVALIEGVQPTLIIDNNEFLDSVKQLVNTHLGNRGISQVFSRKNNPQENQQVLVVDDSVTARETERQLLISAGFDVDVVIDGMMAWKKICLFNYDLVVTDIDMPGMTGTELIHKIRTSKERQDLPIFVVSNNEEILSSHNVSGFLSKNYFTAERFTTEINKILKK